MATYTDGMEGMEMGCVLPVGVWSVYLSSRLYGSSGFVLLLSVADGAAWFFLFLFLSVL
jgi:hypothetical protein